MLGTAIPFTPLEATFPAPLIQDITPCGELKMRNDLVSVDCIAPGRTFEVGDHGVGHRVVCNILRGMWMVPHEVRNERPVHGGREVPAGGIVPGEESLMQGANMGDVGIGHGDPVHWNCTSRL